MTKCLQNLHTHTTYCDGKDTVDEMILAACDKGFRSIGFSSHSFMKGCSLSKQVIDKYKYEIVESKKKYANKIEVYCGIECEMYGDTDFSGFDYAIGALHYLKVEDALFSIDRSIQDLQTVIENHFHGDGMACAKAYYQQLSRLSEYGNFDFVAHFDLITKYNEQVQLFDCQEKEYKWAAIEAAERLAEKIPYFEVNTGAMLRGYRTSPYPDMFLLKELKRLGFGAIISTDCHDSKFLDYGYQEAVGVLKTCGFKEQFILTRDGFIPIEL